MGATRCMTSMSPERRLARRTLSSGMMRNTIAVELGRARIEVVRRALDHDAVLGHALDELPRPHAHRRGAELVAELLVGRRRDRHAGPVGELRGQRRERRLEAQPHGERVDDLDRGDRLQLAPPVGALHRRGAGRARSFTASAFIGVPSLNFTPSRSLMVTVLPPSLTAGMRGGELGQDVQALVDLVELLAHLARR